MPHGRDIVVIGASAGGLDAVAGLLAQLPPDLKAAVFVVLHLQAGAGGGHVHPLDRATPLRVRAATDGATIYHGSVYVAPPDHHLVLGPEHMRVARGPRENLVRPAIDPLFRSAAEVYGARVIGVLLSGHLDDGVAGLAAIRRRGGLAMVQDPGDAAAADLPAGAIARLRVDHCVPVHRMGALLTRAVGEGAAPVPEVDAPRAPLSVERRVAAGEGVSMGEQEGLGEPAGLGCPECGGPLRRIRDPDVRRYRCHVGHAYTARALLSDQSEEVERALSAALRTLEERARLLDDLARDTGGEAPSPGAAGLFARADEARGHASILRRLVLDGGLRSDAA